MSKVQEKKQSVKTILGSMEFGRPGRGTQHQGPCSTMLESFEAKGHVEVDTAYMYQGGRTETIIGVFRDSHPNSRLIYATKVNPRSLGGLSRQGVRAQFNTCLERMQAETVDLLYLHWPDYNNKIEDTLAEIHSLHAEGKFKRFGLSNYSAWQVADICHICRREGYVMPTVYQGMYNALTRAVEPELFPCLRQFGLCFYAYNPLAGGILAGRYSRSDAKSQPTGRFFGNSWAKAYRDRFWNDNYFAAIDGIQTALTQAYGEGKVSLAEASLRWMMHHSLLEGRRGDGIIIGASASGHYQQNMASCAKGPLDVAVVQAFNAGAQITRATWAQYHR